MTLNLISCSFTTPQDKENSHKLEGLAK